MSREVPVVLVPGLTFFRAARGPRGSLESFPGVRAALEARGVPVAVARLTPAAGVTTRAAELAAFVRRTFGDSPVRLVGHSLGGLDARYAVSRLGLDRQVVSVTTVGTPHRGTPFADWGVARFARLLRPLFRALGLEGEAFLDLTTDACARFNETVPDAPDVVYRSVAGNCPADWLGHGWRVPGRIVARHEGANDGVVSVHSAGWGATCEVWEADHLNLINWPNRRMRKAGAWVDRADALARLVAGD